MPPLVLASASPIRARLLGSAGVVFRICPAGVDEPMIRAGLAAKGTPPRDQADALAEAKAHDVARKNPDAVVIGCDQILDFDGTIFSKPADADAARAQLLALRGRTHRLHTATVLYHQGRPVWRNLGEIRLTMRAFSDAYLDGYLARNADTVSASVGGYLLEAEGIRLFSRIEGDLFAALGLPLVPLLDRLARKGFIDA
ncbi:MAG: Maf family protein [Gemmobacter sp.]